MLSPIDASPRGADPVAERRGPYRAALSSRTALFWLLLLALSLALHLLQAEGRGIWQDEGLTLYQVRLPFADILANRIPVAQFMTQNTVPPLYFLLLAAWGRAMGYGLWALRLFSIFCTLLASLLLYRVGTWIDGPRTGRTVALLATLSPFYLWYTQELRMYAFLLLPATLSFGLLWRWRQQWQRGAGASWTYALAYTLVAAALAWTHYLTFLLLAAQGLWLAGVMLRHRPRLLLATGGALLLLALPLIPFGLRRLVAGPERDFFFLPLWAIVNDLLHAFAFGMPVFMSRVEEVRWLFPLAWLLLALGLWQAWRRGGWPLVTLLGGGLVLPTLALYALSYVKPLYQNARHLMGISPAFYLLWAMGLGRLAEIRRWLPLVAILLLGYGWTLSTIHYFDPPQPLKNDVRPLFESLARQYTPGEVVALNDPVLQHALEYFAPGVPWVVLPPYAQPSEEARRQGYEAVASAYDRVWLVYGPPDTTFDTWEEAYEWFDERYARLDYEEFPGQSIIAMTLFDMRGPTIQPDPFPAAQPQEEPFGEALRFQGLYRPLPASLPAGERGVVESLWAVVAPPPDYQFVVQLTDGAGRVWHQEQLVPFAGLHPTSRWQPGDFIALPLFFEPPPTLPPAQYTLALSLVSSEGQVQGPSGASGPLALGMVEVTRPQQPRRIAGPRFGGLRVQAPPPPDSLAAAATLPLVVQVAVVDAAALPDALDLTLEGADGQLAWAQSLPLVDGLPRGSDGVPQGPPDGWKVGDALTLRYDLLLPPTLAGRYTLRLGARQGEQPLTVGRWAGLRRESSFPLGALTIEPRPRRSEVPPFDHAATGEWAGSVRLLGYSVEPEPATPAAPLRVRLVWQAIAPTERPYKVFLHLLDAQGAFVTGADAFFDAPSMAWQEGEILLSDHTFDSSALAPGSYTLLVGLYHEASQERLPVDAPNSALTLGTVQLGAAP